jgi:hypothetical protein
MAHILMGGKKYTQNFYLETYENENNWAKIRSFNFCRGHPIVFLKTKHVVFKIK